jgi:predicted NBD/HSP70 family sugar kinase
MTSTQTPNTNPTHLDLIIADLVTIHADCLDAAATATDPSARAYWTKEARYFAARIARLTH